MNKMGGIAATHKLPYARTLIVAEKSRRINVPLENIAPF
jgi:hypothetical protein